MTLFQSVKESNVIILNFCGSEIQGLIVHGEGMEKNFPRIKMTYVKEEIGIKNTRI